MNIGCIVGLEGAPESILSTAYGPVALLRASHRAAWGCHQPIMI
jgi:hypothetical protein